jgi:hypothetical protein
MLAEGIIFTQHRSDGHELSQMKGHHEEHRYAAWCEIRSYRVVSLSDCSRSLHCSGTNCSVCLVCQLSTQEHAGSFEARNPWRQLEHFHVRRTKKCLPHSLLVDRLWRTSSTVKGTSLQITCVTRERKLCIDPMTKAERTINVACWNVRAATPPVVRHEALQQI